MSWKHFHMCLLCAPFTLANEGVEEMACSIISLKFLFLEVHDNFNLKLKKGNLALIIFVIRKVTSWCSYPWSNSCPERLWLLLVRWSYVQNPHGSDLSLAILTALAPRLQFLYLDIALENGPRLAHLAFQVCWAWASSQNELLGEQVAAADRERRVAGFEIKTKTIDYFLLLLGRELLSFVKYLGKIVAQVGLTKEKRKTRGMTKLIEKEKLNHLLKCNAQGLFWQSFVDVNLFKVWTMIIDVKVEDL